MGPELDLWALGMVLYYMVTGDYLCKGRSVFEMYANFSGLAESFHPSTPLSCSPPSLHEVKLKISPFLLHVSIELQNLLSLFLSINCLKYLTLSSSIDPSFHHEAESIEPQQQQQQQSKPQQSNQEEEKEKEKEKPLALASQQNIKDDIASEKTYHSEVFPFIQDLSVYYTPSGVRGSNSMPEISHSGWTQVVADRSLQGYSTHAVDADNPSHEPLAPLSLPISGQ